MQSLLIDGGKSVHCERLGSANRRARERRDSRENERLSAALLNAIVIWKRRDASEAAIESCTITMSRTSIPELAGLTYDSAGKRANAD